jgi:DNA-binding IclR family transcriptional regulator
VRVAEAPTPVHISMRHGTVMSLRTTASGWLYAAYAPAQTVRAVLALEGDRTPVDDARFAAALAEVRKHRLGRVVDQSMPGVSAMAAPVFDANGTLVLALTAIGPSAVFDTRWNGAVARALQERARGLDQRLGALPAR